VHSLIIYTRRLGLLGLLLVLCFGISLSVGASAAWFSGDPTLLQQSNEISLDDFNEIEKTKWGESAGLECIEKKIARRAFGTLNIQYEDVCWYNTKIGLLSKRGDYLLQPGESVAGFIGIASPTNPVLSPTPNPDVLLELTPAPAGGGYYLAFRHVNDVSFNRSVHPTGTVTLTQQKPPTHTVLNANGSRFFFDQTVSWSIDGSYMLAWSDRGILYRFNMQNYRSIAAYVAEYPGSPMWGSAGLSPSNNLAAATIHRTGASSNVYLVDFLSCGSEQSRITIDKTCRVKSLKTWLQATIPGYSVSYLPRFYGDNTLSLYRRSPSDGSRFIQYFLQANGTTYKSNGYLALGDSFSSGEGAGDYIDGTDNKPLNMCHTSKNSYPYLINERINVSSFLSVACSGAVINNFLYEVSFNKISDDDTRPGVRTQFDVLKDFMPNTITVTMSGNDIGFGDKLRYCIGSASSCYNTYEERLEIANEIKNQHSRLVAMYESILKTDIGSRKLYVIGYPQLASSDKDAQCAVNVHLNEYQREMANDLVTYLNAVIKSAAEHAGAFYVGTEGALNGHKLCEGPSATVAINGLTFGDESFDVGPFSKASFHPNHLGHQLLRDAILLKTSSLTAVMPVKNTSNPIPNPANYAFLDVPSGGGVIHRLKYNPITDNPLLKKFVPHVVEYTNPLDSFKPGSLVNLVLKSDTYDLGQVVTNQLGSVSTIITLPDDVPPGMHELQLNGIDEFSKPLSVRQYVYVIETEQDYDGDGVLNELEPCGSFIEPINQDVDLDGLDDACDLLIGVAIKSDTSSTKTETVLATSLATNNSQSSPNSLQVSVATNVATLGLSTTPTPSISITPPNTAKTDAPGLRISKAKESNLAFYMAGTIMLITILSYSTYSYAKNHKEA